MDGPLFATPIEYLPYFPAQNYKFDFDFDGPLIQSWHQNLVLKVIDFRMIFFGVSKMG